jgi:hypothetical protein
VVKKQAHDERALHNLFERAIMRPLPEKSGGVSSTVVCSICFEGGISFKTEEPARRDIE